MSNPAQFSAAPPPWPPASRRPTQWLAVISLVVALLAVCVAIGSWFRPSANDQSTPTSTSTAPSYSTQQVADAKTKICAAYEKVHHALVLSSARNGGNDPTAALGVATSGRQVLDAGSRYLVTKLSEEQATSPELTSAIRNLANAYQELAIDYLNDLTNSDAQLQPVLQAADDASAAIERLCR
jgi:Cu/Ag efflux pump CusA